MIGSKCAALEGELLPEGSIEGIAPVLKLFTGPHGMRLGRGLHRGLEVRRDDALHVGPGARGVFHEGPDLTVRLGIPTTSLPCIIFIVS